MKIGSFGKKREENDDYSNLDVFDWCGEDIRMVADLDVTSLAEMIAEDAESGSPQAIVNMYKHFRSMIAADEYRQPTDEEREAGQTEKVFVKSDYSQFINLAKQNRVEYEDLRKLYDGLLVHFWTRPAKEPSDS